MTEATLAYVSYLVALRSMVDADPGINALTAALTNGVTCSWHRDHGGLVAGSGMPPVRIQAEDLDGQRWARNPSFEADVSGTDIVQNGTTQASEGT